MFCCNGCQADFWWDLGRQATLDEVIGQVENVNFSVADLRTIQYLVLEEHTKRMHLVKKGFQAGRLNGKVTILNLKIAERFWHFII